LPNRNHIAIDLPSQKILLDDETAIHFTIDALHKEALIKGIDPIGSTLEKVDLIREFEKQHLQSNPWLK